MVDALIQTDPERPLDIDTVIADIERIGGVVLLSLPPSAVVASIPEQRIHELRGKTGLRSVDTEEIAAGRIVAASDETRAIAAIWNEHLRKKRASGGTPPRGQSWDAPGRQPPDAPHDVMERLRRREREAQDDATKQNEPDAGP